MGQNTTPNWFVRQLSESVKDKRGTGAGMTEIAYKCGISTQMLYAYLRGDGEPKIGTYIAMARYFGWDHPLTGEDDVAVADHFPWNAQTPSDLGKQVVMSGVQ